MFRGAKSRVLPPFRLIGKYKMANVASEPNCIEPGHCSQSGLMGSIATMQAPLTHWPATRTLSRGMPTALGHMAKEEECFGNTKPCGMLWYRSSSSHILSWHRGMYHEVQPASLRPVSVACAFCKPCLRKVGHPPWLLQANSIVVLHDFAALYVVMQRN